MSAKQLYTVEIRTEIVVLAESEREAEDIATSPTNFGDIDDWETFAQPMRVFPGVWDERCLPFEDGRGEDITVGEWIARGAAPELKAAMPKKEAT